MQIRTDLALEQKEIKSPDSEGIECEEYKNQGIKFTKIKIKNTIGAKALLKPIGTYITAELEPFSDNVPSIDSAITVSKEIKKLLPKQGLVLVACLGNTQITPDALGPKTALGVFATRHIGNELARAAGLEGIRPCAVVSPGVLGQTGVETAEIIKGITKKIKPEVIIAVDALASRKLSRLGCTVQICDTGIQPGAGVGNARNELSEKNLGVKVIAVGIPTVVDAATLVYDLTGNEKLAEPDGRKMIITPREIDLIISRSSKFLANCINCAIQPNIKPELINEMME